MYTEIALSPAALAFWRISSQREGTGKRNVWNSPELPNVCKVLAAGVKAHKLTISGYAVPVGQVCSCPTVLGLCGHWRRRWVRWARKMSSHHGRLSRHPKGMASVGSRTMKGESEERWR